MKKCSKVLSILLATLMVVSIMFVGATAEELAEEPVTVNGEELLITNWGGTDNLTVGVPTTGTAFYAQNDKTPLLPEFQSTRVTFGWDKDANYITNNENAIVRDEDGEILRFDDIASYYSKYYEIKKSHAKIQRFNASMTMFDTATYDNCQDYVVDIYNEGNKKGIMFYVKLDENSNDTGIFFEGMSVGFDDNGNIIPKEGSTSYFQHSNALEPDSPVYLMTAGTDNWNEATTVALGNGERRKDGSIPFEGGFEGWVYVPAASWIDDTKIATSKYLYRVNWFVNELVAGKDIQISNLMVVDGDAEDVINAEGVTVNGKPYKFADYTYYSATPLNVSNSATSMTDAYEMAREGGNLAPSYGEENTVLETKLKDAYSRRFAEPSYYNYAITPTVKSTQSIRPNYSSYNFQVLSVTEEANNLIKVQSYIRCDSTTYPEAQWPDLYALFDGDNYVGGIFPSPALSNDRTAKVNAYIQTSTSHKITSSDAILAYVKHQGATEPIKISFEAQNTGMKSNSEIYAYDLKTGKWNVCELTEENNHGCVAIPTDFEGWYMLPGAAFSDSDLNVNTFRICPDKLGGDYGELLFGNITLIDNFNPVEMADSSVIVLPAETTLPSNFPFKTILATEVTPKKEAYRIEKSSNGGIYGFSASHNVSTKTVTFTATKDFAPEVTDETLTYGSTTSVSVAKIDFYDDDSTTRINISGSESETAYQAIMFKVKNNTEKDISVLVGHNTTLLKASSPYHLLRDMNNSWKDERTSSTITVTIGADERSGAPITIPANFEGWISIPIATYRDRLTEMNRITFLPVTDFVGSITISDISFSANVTPTYYSQDNVFKGMNSKIGDLSAYSEENVKTVTVQNGVLESDYDGLYTELIAKGSIASGGALMFYAKNDSDNEVAFKTSLGNDASAYTVANRRWESISTDVEITLSPRFEGWVKIAVSDAVKFDSIKLTFTSLANGLKLSDFMTLNQSDDLITNIKRGTRYPTGLFYTKGDYNLDAIIDIRDFLCAGKGKYKHEITKFDPEFDVADEVHALRQYFFNK